MIGRGDSLGMVGRNYENQMLASRNLEHDVGAKALQNSEPQEVIREGHWKWCSSYSNSRLRCCHILRILDHVCQSSIDEVLSLLVTQF